MFKMYTDERTFARDGVMSPLFILPPIAAVAAATSIHIRIQVVSVFGSAKQDAIQPNRRVT